MGLAGTRSWRGMPCADVLWELTGRPAGYKAARLCDPQLPIRTAPGIACRRARPGDTPSPLLLPLLLPLTLWRVNVWPGNQSQRSPRCSQKRFSSNIDNKSLWKFTSTVDAVASRRLCFCSCFWANSLCWSSMAWGWQLRAWGAAAAATAAACGCCCGYCSPGTAGTAATSLPGADVPPRGLVGPAPAHPRLPGSSCAPAAAAPSPSLRAQPAPSRPSRAPPSPRPPSGTP